MARRPIYNHCGLRQAPWNKVSSNIACHHNTAKAFEDHDDPKVEYPLRMLYVVLRYGNFSDWRSKLWRNHARSVFSAQHIALLERTR
jgi:hypothetical protein